MIVPDDVRKCVGFVGLRLANGTFRFAGSLFFLGRDTPGEAQAKRVYAVTAKHVIEGIRRTGVTDVWLRLNLKDGEATWFNTPLSEWFTHPTDTTIDVAIRETGVPSTLDHLVFPYSLCVTDDILKKNEIGLGDEVFITGLFRHHHGVRKNIPIVRIGNLACLTEERISTKFFGEMDGYLIEARSIGGLSGSPVFLNLGVARLIEKEVKFTQGGPIFFLLGLIHGHYDVLASEVDEGQEDTENNLLPERVNTGIAIVIPFHKVDAVVLAYERLQSAS